MQPSLCRSPKITTMSGPRTLHRPTFTAEQVAQARQLAAQHSAPHRTVRRARLTLVLAAHPDLTHEEAGRRCGLEKETVYKWRRRWRQHGWSLGDAPRSGRPRVFPP